MLATASLSRTNDFQKQTYLDYDTKMCSIEGYTEYKL